MNKPRELHHDDMVWVPKKYYASAVREAKRLELENSKLKAILTTLVTYSDNEFNLTSAIEEARLILEEAIKNDPDYDPTPWCSGCNAMTSTKCHCGPRADND